MMFTAHRGSSRKWEEDKRITGADGSAMNPHSGTVHHGGEKLKSVRLTVSWWGRCAPEAEGGR
jgi:hypothetical protein